MPKFLVELNDGRKFQVEANRQPTPEEAMQLLSGGEQPALSDKPYLSQLGEALSTGYGQMTSGVGATFNALTGDTPDVAANLAEMGRLQREQQASRTAEDIALTQDFARSKAAYEQAQGPLETIEALGGYLGATARNPGAAFKQAVQSAPNALISGVTGLAGYGLGGLLGAGAGIETGPGAILTGIAGAAAGGAVSNTLMEAGPAIYDILNERTGGAAANMTADEITAYLNENPDVMSEGLKTGAIRGSVIGLVEGLGLKGAGALSTIPERAAARAVQKTLVDAGVDVASKEAVEAAVKNPAIFAAIKQAGETAKQQFSSAGNLARMGGAAGIEIGASGAGEAGAQMATGREVDPTEVYQEMLGEVGLSLPMALGSKIIDSRKYLSPTEGITGMPPPLESQIAAEALNATTDTPFTDISGQAAADTIAQNTELAMRMPIQPVETVEEAPVEDSADPEFLQKRWQSLEDRALSVIEAGAMDRLPAIRDEQARLVERIERITAMKTPSPEMEMLEKPSQTITGSNGEIAPEMPVPVESTVTSPGEAPPSLPEAGPPVVDNEAPTGTPVQAAPIQPVETQEDAIQEQITDEGLLRQERPEMELQGLGEGNAQPQEVAAEGQIQEEVAPPITPQGTPTTATEGKVMPGGGAIERDATKGITFRYEMRARPPSIGTHPENGFVSHEEGGTRHGFLTYDRPLTEQEIYDYELKPVATDSTKPTSVSSAKPTESGGKAESIGSEQNQRDKGLTSSDKPDNSADRPVAPKKGDLVTVALGGREYPKTRIINVVNTLEGVRYQVDVFGSKFVPESSIVAIEKPVVKDATKIAATPQIVRQLGDIAVKNKQPLDQGYIDSIGGNIPQGYVKQGDLYVFQPSSAFGAGAATAPKASKALSNEPDATDGRLYTIYMTKGKDGKERHYIPNLAPMTHSEALAFRKSQMEPAKWGLEDVTSQFTQESADQKRAEKGMQPVPVLSQTTAAETQTSGVATERETDEERFQRIKNISPSQRTDEDIAFANAFSKRQKELKPQAGETTRKAFISSHTASIGGRLRKALDQGMNFRGLKGTVGSWVETLYNEGWRMALDARGNRQFTNGKEALGSSGLGKVGMNYADFLSSQPQTKQAAETQTPESVAVDSGAAGVVQSEPSRGSILEVEKESTKTAIESTGKSAPSGYGEVVNSARKSLKERPADFKAQEQVLSDLMKLPVADLQSAFEVVTGSPTKLANKRQLANNVLNSLLAEAQESQPTAAEDTFRKAEQEAEEEIQRQNAQSISNLFDKLRTNPQRGQVTRADVNQAIGALQNSGEVPNAIFTWTGTTEDLLRQRATMERQFPGAFAAASMPNVEGVFENGMAFVFSNRVVVTDLDRRKADEEGISPSVAAVKRVVTHENFHKGLWLLSPKRRSDIMSFLRQMFPAAELDELAKSYRQYADWRTNPAHEMALLDERLQKYIEETKAIPADGVWKQFWDYIKEIWRKLTGKPKGEPTIQSMKDVVRLIRSALKNAHKARPDRTIDGGRVLMSYIGESAIENFPEERRQFMRDSLETAKAMAAAGKDSEEIRAATGWFPGKYDGKMRWELPDEGAFLKTDFGKATKLSELIDHPALFNAYPSMADVPVEFRGLVAGITPDGKTLVLPLITRGFGSDNKAILDGVLHESQHLIQGIEGFARGGSPEMVYEPEKRRIAQKKSELEEQRDRAQQAWKERMTDENLAAFKAAVDAVWEVMGEKPKKLPVESEMAYYKRIAGEIESRDIEARRELTPEQRAAIAPYSSENIASEDAIVLFGNGPQMSVSGGRRFAPAVNIDGRVEIGASHYDAWIKHALRQIPNFKKDGLSDEERRQLADRWIVDHPEFMAYSLRKEGFVSDGEFLNRQDSLKKFKSLGGVQQMAPGEPDRDWLDASDVEGYRFSYASEQDEASSIGQQTARYAASSPRTIEAIVGVRQAYASMPKSNGAAAMLDDLFAETAKLVPTLTRPEFDRVIQGMYDDNAALLNDAQNPSSVTILPGAMMSMAGGANDAEYFAAVEAGDMEKAQRMVDEAAKAAVKPFSIKLEGKGTSSNGWIVSLGNRTVKIFRDPENGYWYFSDFMQTGEHAPIASNKEDAIKIAVERLEEEMGGAQPSTEVLFQDWREDKTITLPGYYLRFGELPAGGRSSIGNQPGLREKGVSVLKAWKSPNGVFVISSATSETGASDMVAGMEERSIYIAYGEDTGEVGSDGEPLLKNVVLTEQVMNNRVVVDDPSYINQPITNNVSDFKDWETIEPSPDPLGAADPVTYDDAGNVIPPSKRFGPSPDARFSIASTPEQQSAAAKFKSAITAAAKGLPDLREYEGRLVKAASGEAIDVEPHNVLWFDGFMKASEQLLSDLQKQGLSLQQIYDKVAMDTEFKRELGLFDEETGSGQAATVLSGLLLQRTLNAARKARTAEAKAQGDALHRKAAAYYSALATARGQNLLMYRLLQNDPRTRFAFMEDKVTREMLKKAEHGVNVQFGDSYAATQDAVNDAVDASAEAAKTEVADAVENAAEEDQDAIDLAEGEATLTGKLRELYEKLKDLLRENGILARLDKEEQDIGAKMSISPERRSELVKLTKEERAKLRQKNEAKIEEILKAILGEESEAKTPEQKSTRKKREKMVKTAKKRAEKGQDIDIKPTDLSKIINQVRRDIKTPLGKPIQWREIFRQPGKTVEEYRQNIFNAVNSNEAFKDLDEAQKRRLSELFAEAWQAQRDKILKSMIEQHTYSLERQQKKEAAKALRDARNQIIEAVNLGAFSNDELTRVLGEKFGFKTSFTEDEKQKLSELAEKLQDEKLNKAKRNKLAREFLSTLQSGTQIPIAELLSNWWVSAVLSGGNTVSAIALSFLNGTGIGIMGTHLSRALRELMKGNTANAIDAITSLFKAYAKHISSFPTAANRAWQYLWSGDVSFLESAANDPFGRVNTLADIAKYQVVADQVAKDPNKVKAVMGRFMQFMGRLLTALDAFNVMVTKAGTVSLAIRQSGLTPEQIRDAELKNDLKFYKDKIVREDPHFGGKQPTSAKEKAYLSSLAEAEMYADLAEMGVKMENADYLASESAMTMNPTGFGGIVYNSIKALDTKVTSETEKHLDMAQVAWAKSKNAEDAIKLFTWSLVHFFAKQGLNVFGLRFARFAGNKFNQSLSFVPGLGLLRMIEADNKELAGRQEAFKDTIIRNQTLGWIIMFAGWAIIKAIEEEPDDEKRGWFINGGWNNLTPDQKKQKISRGEKQYTIGTGDYVFNYQNWPISQPLAALGALSDLVRFSQDKWKEKTTGGKAGSAVISGMQAALEIPALTQVNEIFANTMASKDPAEQTASRLSRVTAGWMGGFMPRILKDLDYIQDPTMKRYETLFQKVASHVPVYRRYVGSDYYDILGNKIEKNAIPGSRDFMKLEDKPEYRMLGALNARGIWLTPANAEYRMVGKGRFRRRLTQEEADRYSLETGKLYRQMVMNYGPRALQMPVERAKDYISAKADDMRDLALQRAVRN